MYDILHSEYYLERIEHFCGGKREELRGKS